MKFTHKLLTAAALSEGKTKLGQFALLNYLVI